MKLKIDRRTQIVQGDKKVIRAWIMYDWSNSVFQLTVLSVIFPTFYISMTSTGGSSVVSFLGINIINSVLYSWAIAFAYLIVAVFSPFFSSIADYTGRRRGFMRFFTLLGAISCSMLFFFTRSNLEFGIIAFVLATIGYCGSLVFYNSFLPVIAPPKDQDRISANGFAMGYLGGVILLLINLGMIMKPDFFGISDKSLPARISFVTVGVWWIGFSLITFLKLPKYTLGNRSKKGKTLTRGYQELKKVFQQVKKMPQLRVFLYAYLFMTMGVLNVMFMSANYGAKELHLDNNVLIPIILLIQLLGMVGAWLFVRVSKRLGNVKALIISIVGWILVVFGAYLITDALGFSFVAFFVGLVMGGSQATARSTYSKMIPEDTHDHTSFFSFYDVMEKVATAVGTFSFGIIEAVTGSMRMSVLAVDLFFFVALLLFVRLLILKKREKVKMDA